VHCVSPSHLLAPQVPAALFARYILSLVPPSHHSHFIFVYFAIAVNKDFRHFYQSVTIIKLIPINGNKAKSFSLILDSACLALDYALSWIILFNSHILGHNIE